MSFGHEGVADRDLVAMSKSGSHDAFATLFERHKNYVLGISRNILQRGDLEDICQDCFLLAYTNISSFSGNCTFRSWITRIAVNQCLQQLRSVRTKKRASSGTISIDEVPISSPFLGRSENGYRRVESRIEIERIFAGLKDKSQALLLAAYVEEYSLEELAGMYSCSPRTVANKLQRIKTNLRHKRKTA